MSERLREEQLLELIETLNKYYNSLAAGSRQRIEIGKFITYLENELKELIWEKYRDEKGLW